MTLNDLANILSYRNSNIILPGFKKLVVTNNGNETQFNKLSEEQINDGINQPEQEQVKKFAELQEILSNKDFLEGAKKVYESTPDLQKYGTQEEYNDYVARIILGIIKNPTSGDYNYNSKVKDIVYHGTIYEFDKFNRGINGIHFTKDRKIAETKFGLPNQQLINAIPELQEKYKGKNSRVISAILNANKIDRQEDKFVFKGDRDFEIESKRFRELNKEYDAIEYTNKFEGGEKDSILVFEPEQIHILGGKEDIEGFKQWNIDRQVLGVRKELQDTKETFLKDTLIEELSSKISLGNSNSISLTLQNSIKLEIPIETEFVLNSEQEKAFKEISEFIKKPISSTYKIPSKTRKGEFDINPENCWLLSGAGGTGKTFLIGKIIKESNKNFHFATPSHNAKRELMNSLVDSNFYINVDTLQSILGISTTNGKDFFLESRESERGRRVFPIDNIQYLVIDEASMVGGDLYEAMLKRFEEIGRSPKIIFLGDYAQIPPPSQKDKTRDSEVIDLLYHQNKDRVSLLTINMRAKYKDLADKNLQLRSFIDRINDILIYNKKSQNTIKNVLEDFNKYIKTKKLTKNTSLFNKENYEDFWSKYVEQYKEMLSSNLSLKHLVMVSYNNQKTKPELVQIVRSKLFGDNQKNKINVNELLVINNNELNVPNSVNLYKDERILVLKIEDSKSNKIFIPINNKTSKGIILNLKHKILTVKAEDGEIYKIIYPEKPLNEIIKDVNSNNFKDFDINSLPKTKNDSINKNQIIFELSKNILEFDYGYVVTSHRVQGSTYDNVYVLEDNILNSNASEKEKLQLLYTAYSRAKKHLNILNKDQIILPDNGEYDNTEIINSYQKRLKPFSIPNIKNEDVKEIKVPSEFYSEIKEILYRHFLKQIKKENQKEVPITLNIFGDNIYELTNKYSQKLLDDFLYNLLKSITESPNFKNKISLIKTSGETGIEEAANKASNSLKIPNVTLTTKDWKFTVDIDTFNKNYKDRVSSYKIDGSDVYIFNEKYFKERFNADIKQEETTNENNEFFISSKNLNNKIIVLLKDKIVPDAIIENDEFFRRNKYGITDEFYIDKDNLYINIDKFRTSKSIKNLIPLFVYSIKKDNSEFYQELLKPIKSLPFYPKEFDTIISKYSNVQIDIEAELLIDTLFNKYDFYPKELIQKFENAVKEKLSKWLGNDNFFEAKNSNFGIDENLRSKYFSESETVKSSEILNKIANSASKHRNLARKLLEHINQNDVNIILLGEKNYDIDFAGLYSHGTNEIFINENGLFGDIESEGVIIHEIIHALTLHKLKNNKNEYSKEFTRIFNEIKNSDLEEVKKLIKDFEYETSNVFEFITNLFTNNEFQNRLKQLPDLKNKDKSIFQNIIDFINRLFGFKENNELFDNLNKLSYKILDTKDPRIFETGDKLIDLNDIDEKSVYYVLNKISTLNHPLSKLAEKLLPYSENLGVNFYLVDVVGTKKKRILEKNQEINYNLGFYTYDSNFRDEIYINKNNIYKNKDSIPTLMHEAIHSLTYHNLRKNSEYVEELKRIYNYVKANTNENFYALKDLDEFMVGIFTDSRFINYLKTIKPIEIKKYNNVFEELIDFFLSIFKIEKGESIYEQAFIVASNIFENEEIPIPNEEFFTQDSDERDIYYQINILQEEFFNFYKTLSEQNTEDYLIKYIYPSNIDTILEELNADDKVKQELKDYFLSNRELIYSAPNIYELVNSYISNKEAFEYSSISKKADKELDSLLLDYLKPLNIEVRDLNEIKSKLKINSLGVADIINKLIYVAQDRNIDTLPEEVAHFYVELLEKRNKKGEERKYLLYRDLMSKISSWEKYDTYYKQYSKIYLNPDGTVDENKVKKEIVGKAIAEALVRKFETKNKQLKSLVQKLIDYLKSIFKNRPVFPINLLVDDIAEKILNKDYSDINKDLLKGEFLKDYFDISNDIKSLIKNFSSLGAILTGSLPLRLYGSIYRTKEEEFHDFDFKIPKDINKQEIIEKVKQLYPSYELKTEFDSSNNYSLLFTIEHNGKKYDIDFFFQKDDFNIEPKFKYMHWYDTFKAKLEMGRAKDVKDFINFKPYERIYEDTPTLQKPSDFYYQIEPDKRANILIQNNLPTEGLVLPIGISGSGKSTWINTIPNKIVVSPDEIRKELTGNISDQSRNKEVFEIAKQRAANYLKQGNLVVFDATNVNTVLRNNLIKDIESLLGYQVPLSYKIFESDPEISKQRIKNDIISGKDRANVPDHIIEIQYQQYLDTLNNLSIPRFQLFKEEENNTETYKNEALEKTIRDIAARASIRIGIPFEIINNKNFKTKGYFSNGKATINIAYATLDTPIHEILGHPIIYYLRKTNSKLYNNLLKELEYGKGKEVLESTRKYYSNQQLIDEDAIKEEAIVELLGLYTANKIKESENKSLFSYLRELLKTVKSIVRELLNKKEIKIDELPDNLTISDLSKILAYGNNTFILPQFDVKYRTPDNNYFLTYAEASKHISDLFNKSLKEEDFNLTLEDLYNFSEKDKEKLFELRREQELTVNEKRELKRLEILYRFYPFKKEIENFIDYNQKYEISNFFIQKWKEIEGIIYNPNEVYKNNMNFYHKIGAYSYFDPSLLLQNLLVHIEDHEREGFDFIVSAFTRRKNERAQFESIQNNDIRIVIYPKKEDIVAAYRKDIWSGTAYLSKAVSEYFTNKRMELVGITATKAATYQFNSFPEYNLYDTLNYDVEYDIDFEYDKLYNYNEILIKLKGNNFRLEYDRDVIPTLKNLIDKINAILDSKYGKIEMPKVKATYVVEEQTRPNRYFEIAGPLKDYNNLEIDGYLDLKEYYKKKNIKNIFLNKKDNKYLIIANKFDGSEEILEEHEIEKIAEFRYKLYTGQEKPDFTKKANENFRLSQLKELNRKYLRSLIYTEIINKEYPIDLYNETFFQRIKPNSSILDKRIDYLIEEFGDENLKEQINKTKFYNVYKEDDKEILNLIKSGRITQICQV